MSIKEMNAITVADDLVEFLRDRPEYPGCVHSVFPHAVNIMIREDELITLTSRGAITPMGIMADNGASFKQNLEPGDKLILNSERFTAVNGAFSLKLKGAKVWATRPWIKLNPRSTGKVGQIKLQLTRWLRKQPALGLLPLLPRLTNNAVDSDQIRGNLYSRYIADDLSAFTSALAGFEWENALNMADKLVGFGMGSTPACDDFLAAYLLVFTIFEALNPDRLPWLQEFNTAIATKAKERSTLISANMLRHAGTGKTSRSHQQLIQACLSNEETDLNNLASQVMRHGATSGGDFLLGLVCALEWYQTAMINYVEEGERAWIESERLQSVPII